MAGTKLQKQQKERTQSDPEIEIEGVVRPGKWAFLRRTRYRILIGAVVLVVIVLVILILILELVISKERRVQRRAVNSQQGTAGLYSVVPANFPDPSLIENNGNFYAFATRPVTNVTLNIQVASTTVGGGSIADWTLHEGYDALPVLPSWVKTSGDAAVWAPVVSQRADGTFVMIYSALHEDHPTKHCLGVATSSTVMGPYHYDSEEPLVCHVTLGGNIDPTVFFDPLDGNKAFVIYKNDGNAIGTGGACGNGHWPNTPTTFQWSQVNSKWTGAQTAQGKALAMNDVDEATIFMQNAESDGSNIEAPMIWHQQYSTKQAYHLLYNAGCFADQSYRIQHIVCWLDDNIKSFQDCPWQTLKDTSAETLLQTEKYAQPAGRPTASLLAPGGPSVSQDGRYLAFHADVSASWFNSNQPASQRKRGLYIAELEYPETGSGLAVKQLVMPESS